MQFKEFVEEIATRSKVEPDVARRVLTEFYGLANEKLDQGDEVVLPKFGKIVPRQNAEGETRYSLRRRTPAEA